MRYSKKSDPWVGIGEIASRVGITVSALRFYADRQLVPFSRDTGGRRRFRKSSIRRVSFILIAQQLGYTLNQISDVLTALPDNRTPTKADWKKIGQFISFGTR